MEARACLTLLFGGLACGISFFLSLECGLGLWRGLDPLTGSVCSLVQSILSDSFLHLIEPKLSLTKNDGSGVASPKNCHRD